jgi:Bacterial Ig-like domain (group 2)
MISQPRAKHFLWQLIFCLFTLSTSTTAAAAAPTIKVITVTPARTTIGEGSTIQFKATATMSDGSTEDVTATSLWTTSHPEFATITSTGLAKGVGLGASNMAAKIGAVTGATILTVGKATSPTATVKSIAVSPAGASLSVNATLQYTAIATLSDGSTSNVTSSAIWTSSATGIATISAAGVAKGVAAGTSSISAAVGSVKGATTLTVTAGSSGTGTATIKSIVVTPARSTIPQGTSLQFVATATMSDGTTKDVTASSLWTTSHPEFVTITATGLATGVGLGASNLGAKDGAVTGATILTIGKASSGTATVKSIAVTPLNASVAAKGTLQFTAIATLSDGTTSNVSSSATWASSATKFATVNAGGLATGVSAGVTAISAAVGSIKGSTTLTVTGGAGSTATIKSIVITPARTSIPKGSSLQLTATATLSDGTTADVTTTSLWTTSHPEYATVNATGLAQGVGLGASNMAAKNGAITGATILTITPGAVANPTVTSIAVTPANASLAPNATLQYAAIATLSNGTTSDITSTVTWSSSANATATIGVHGLLTAVAVGNATVSAAQGTVSGSTGVTVQTSTTPTSHTDVLTYKNDLSRTGLNSTETLLTTANVNSVNFGLKLHLPIDGLVFAQPLYVSQLMINGALHNAVFLVTEHNSAYAYDSDTGVVLWHTALNVPGETTSDDRDCGQISPEIGVTATPVIDRSVGASGAIYVVAMSRDSGSAYHHRIHALDLATGAEILGGPREVQATYPTTTGTITFDPGSHKDRAGLLLLNGEVYTSWTSHCDDDPYTGWIIAYDGTTLAQTRVFNIAPNSNGFGPSIWQSGGAPAVDSAGFIYLLAAQGVFETTMDANGFPNKQDYGNSFLKISTANHTLAVADYFTMWNEVAETAADLDLGGGGAMLLPDLVDATGAVKHLAIGAGKDVVIYVVDRDSMGRFNPSKNNIWQEIDSGMASALRSTPAYFNGHVYLSDRDHPLKSFTITAAKLPASPSSQSKATFVYPGTSAVVSANGTSNGIVWAQEGSSPGVLHALDATNLAIELYNSKQAANGRDSYGTGGRFVAPAVADGKVFVVGTTEVAVFGLLH